MPCFRPLSAWRQPSGEAGGKPTIVFGRKHLQNYDVAKSLDLPCGQCIGCRLERSRRWAVRLMHEKQFHEKACFITLTYDDDHLPSDGSLQKKHFQDFMKRLRRGSSGPVRFFHCGEYGENTGRPHYHAVLYGIDFSEDRKHLRTTERGDSLYSSQKLTDFWGHGALEQQPIGELTFESAAYVARYCLKKLTVSQKSDPETIQEHCERYFNQVTGTWKEKEYVTMSRRPGIAADWYKKYGKEVYPSDSVVMRGHEMLPPPFYDKLLEKADPALYQRIKKERARSAKKFAESENSTPRRLMDREIVKEETIKKTLRRSV